MVAIDGRQVGFYIFFQLQVSTLGYGFQLQSLIINVIMTYRLTFDLINCNWMTGLFWTGKVVVVENTIMLPYYRIHMKTI